MIISHWYIFFGEVSVKVFCSFYNLVVYIHITRRRQWQATPVLLPRKSHGWRSLVGCIPWGRYESVVTERLFTFMHWRRKWQPTPVFLPEESQGRQSLVAAVHGVAQSRTRLKRLSGGSSIHIAELWVFFVHFTKWSFIRFDFTNIFFSVCGLTLHFLDNVFHGTETLNLNRSVV